MTTIVLLDSGPLGMVINPKGAPETLACGRWFRSLAANGGVFGVSEICDYEVRRELIRENKRKGLQRLDGLCTLIPYFPITTDIMRLAASFWAELRSQGLATADRHALDGDMILAATATSLIQQGHTIIVATTNVRHLSRLIDAREWQDIS